jgi:hypothetical protein
MQRENRRASRHDTTQGAPDDQQLQTVVTRARLSAATTTRGLLLPQIGETHRPIPRISENCPTFDETGQLRLVLLRRVARLFGALPSGLLGCLGGSRLREPPYVPSVILHHLQRFGVDAGVLPAVGSSAWSVGLGPGVHLASHPPDED